MPFLCPAPGITPVVFTALMGSHLGSPVQHWCPSVPNHPAQRNTGKTRLGMILDRAAGQENIPWPVWQGAILECPSGFLLCQGFVPVPIVVCLRFLWSALLKAASVWAPSQLLPRSLGSGIPRSHGESSGAAPGCVFH